MGFTNLNFGSIEKKTNKVMALGTVMGIVELCYYRQRIIKGSHSTTKLNPYPLPPTYSILISLQYSLEMIILLKS